MMLGNQTKSTANIVITSSNGRDISEKLEAGSPLTVDLSSYREPFSVQVTIGSNSANTSGLADSAQVTITQDNSGQVLLQIG